MRGVGQEVTLSHKGLNDENMLEKLEGRKHKKSLSYCL